MGPAQTARHITAVTAHELSVTARSWPWIWLARMPGEYAAVRGGFPECSSDGSIKVHSPWFGVAGAAVWCDVGGRRTY